MQNFLYGATIDLRSLSPSGTVDLCLVEAEVEDTRLLPRDVEVGDRDGLIAQTPRGIQALVTTDDRVIPPARQKRLHQPELLQAARQRGRLRGRDPPRVRRVWTQVVDWNLDNVH